MSRFDESEQARRDIWRSYAAMSVELLFSVLPLIILVIVHVFYKESPEIEIMSLPEWGLMAAVLFGQTIAKITSSAVASAVASARKTRIPHERWTPIPYEHTVTLLVALIMTFGLVPSLVILTLILISTTPSSALIGAQMISFLVSIMAFFFFGRTRYSQQTRAELAR